VTAPNILAVRFSSLGDLVLTTPLFRAVKRAHPSARITLLTRAEYVPLFAHSPRIARVIGWDGETPIGEVARELRKTAWTHRLDLHGSMRSFVVRRLVGGRWHGYPKRRLARAIQIRFKKDVYRDRRHVVERYFDAATGLGLAPDDQPPEVFVAMEAAGAADRFLRESGVANRTLVALVPGAAHFTKRWPEHHWVALTELLTTKGLAVMILGGKADIEVGARLARVAGQHGVNAAGQFDLGGTAALLKRARCAVAGDTGVMHLATAVQTPVVTLLGPTVREFGFTPYNARSTIVERDLDCRPCSKMGGPVCPLGHHHCLEWIAAEEVAEAVRRLPQ
jgi:lipopolysaccharide heptosyltransferase II